MIFGEMYQTGKTVVDRSAGNLEIFRQNMHPWFAALPSCMLNSLLGLRQQLYSQNSIHACCKYWCA